MQKERASKSTEYGDAVTVYLYDSDLELYYLMSRYYDSETGRFISPDGYVSYYCQG